MDWEAFFRDHGIDYVTRGSNVKRGNVNIACPFCGDDPSHHMGVSLEDKGYGCWRSANHVGKKPTGLIRALLGCSFNQAKVIAQQYSAADPEDLDDALKALQGDDTAPTKPVKRKGLTFHPSFKAIKPQGTTRRFFEYLEGRGFTYQQVKELIRVYNLKCATTGKWKDRIIIPIFKNSRLVSWTSRAIGKNIDAPRYKALGEDDQDNAGLVNVFHTLWNWDECVLGGKLLVIVEGPFDAIKLDFLAFYVLQEDVTVTCTFGTAMSDEQAMLIAEIAPKYNRAVLLYDDAATEAIFTAKEKLAHTKVEIGFLADNLKDPGEMNIRHVRKFLCEYLV